MRRSWNAALTVTAALLLAVLACAPVARGAGIPLDGGEIRLALATGLERALRDEGVAVKSIGPATLKGGKVTLPMQAASFDPDAGTGTFTPFGGFKLVAGKRSVALFLFELNSSTKALSATVAGKPLRLAQLGGAKLERDGFGARLSAKRLTLTKAGANALNRVLGLPAVLRAGRSLGSVRARSEPSAVPISFGQIAIGGPDTVFSKLESLGVQIGIWGATEAWRAPGENYFLFSVNPTTVTADASFGFVEGAENDGVTMEIHAPPPRQMLLRHPRIDLATRELSATLSPLSTENPVRAPIATLDFSAANFQIRPNVRAFELLGVRAISNQLIADQLNERFAMPGTFQAGETLARMTVTLHAR